MNNILVTGSNSYVGVNVQKWLGLRSGIYMIDEIDMKSAAWKEKDFSKYDVVFHVAGIAHISSDSALKDMYYKVNHDLAVDTAQKAKNEGVKQFIFMSSIIVYGSPESGLINKTTVPQPNNDYGKSKLQAEEDLLRLASDSFKVVILRPPMIYGKGSKGNYPRLVKVAKILPIFPDYDNRRSVLHIDNLCEFVRLVIDNEEQGLFFPQNSNYIRTSDMVRLIAEANDKNIKLTKFFNPLIKVMGLKFKIAQKVFGDLAYDLDMSEYRCNYRVRNLQDSITMTET